MTPGGVLTMPKNPAFYGQAAIYAAKLAAFTTVSAVNMSVRAVGAVLDSTGNRLFLTTMDSKRAYFAATGNPLPPRKGAPVLPF